jgi:translation initiation factor 1 (eIF-1/SUI1)
MILIKQIDPKKREEMMKKVRDYKVVSVRTIGQDKYQMRVRKAGNSKTKSITLINKSSLFVANGHEIIAELEKRFGCKLYISKNKVFRALIQKKKNKNTITFFEELR